MVKLVVAGRLTRNVMGTKGAGDAPKLRAINSNSLYAMFKSQIDFIVITLYARQLRFGV